MNFNVYLDDPTARRLTSAAKRGRTTRNALIREAVREWLERGGARQWPSVVREFRGVGEFPPFEQHRGELAAESADPFETR